MSGRAMTVVAVIGRIVFALPTAVLALFRSGGDRDVLQP
jgi:hypothetical protein